MEIPGSWPESPTSGNGEDSNDPSGMGYTDNEGDAFSEPNTTVEYSVNKGDDVDPADEPIDGTLGQAHSARSNAATKSSPSSQSDGTTTPPTNASVSATAEDQSQIHPHQIQSAMTRLQIGEDPRSAADAAAHTALEGSVAPFLPSHPLIARLQQHQTTSSTSNATAMEALEALHSREISWLQQQHEDSTARMRDELRDLRVENHELEIELRRHERTIADKDQQIFHLTSSGQPHPTEACALCGRVGDRYAGDAEEPVKDKASGSNRKARETPSNGKSWDDDPTTYTLPTRRAPDHHHNKAARIEAMIRRRDGRPKPGDKELIEWECSSDDEEVQAGKIDTEADPDDEDGNDGWAADGALSMRGTTNSSGGW
ncbi:uncharacterized protein AB675_3991 [Cyphellophora attinorum]|uniref:Uncharacterized protein n=1 Tax=Cyphellophora attinorum TaxID=1664694 RepID=A0A0N1NZF6_9EURO|nr:uncharacterized protein AB675_3991 [Phialophora attinorum]KPI37552.1 hypothetical protein AB675_3991 [Phialophora attinorum]